MNKIRLFISLISIVLIGTTSSFADETKEVPYYVTKFLELKNTDLYIGKQYFNGFESLADFKNQYIVPQNYKGTSSHDLSKENARFGKFSHKAWIYGTNPVVTGENTNHRAYPAFQFSKTPEGVFMNRVLVEFWVWADFNIMNSPNKNWISLATFTSYNDNRWSRAYLINVDHNNFVHLMHVPNNEEHIEDIYQTHSLRLPMKKWVKITSYIDYTTANRFSSPFIAVWQDGELVSAARFNPRLNLSVDLHVHKGWVLPKCLNGVNDYSPIDIVEKNCGLDYTGGLAQAHFGLYAPPKLSSGKIYNDDLTVSEIKKK